MTKRIQLTQGYWTLVDDEDYENVKQHSWHAFWNGWLLYAARGSGRNRVLMHRFIMGFPKGRQVMHLDDNGLNNTRANFMIGSARENTRNGTIFSSNTSGTRGVCLDKSRGKYVARISCDEGVVFLGRFDTLEEATTARKAAEVKYWRGRSSLYPTSNQPQPSS